MHRSRFSILSVLTLLAAPAVALARAVVAPIVWLIDAALSLIPTRPSPFVIAHGFSLEVPGGVSIAPDLLHSIRHEAGVKRRAAARNT